MYDPLTWPVTARDGYSTTYSHSDSIINPLNGALVTQSRQVVRVATGLNYLDDNGVWQPSEDLIQLTPGGGAAAVNGPHKVYFSPNGLNDDDALTIVTVDNRVFQARVLGVYYFDTSSGLSKLLAAPSDVAAGELHPPNQLVYPAAFSSGALQADLRYTYTKGGFESEVILTAQPKVSPGDCGFNPATTVLQVRHQWIAPTPAIQPITVVSAAGAEVQDELLYFGDLFFPSGQAFTTDGSSSTDTNVAARIVVATADHPSGIPVGKQWQAGQGSSTLVESVAWSAIATKLAQLPQMAEAAAPSPAPQLAAVPGMQTTNTTCTSGKRPIQLAAARPRTTGVVIDYQIITGGTSFTFASFSPGNIEYVIDADDGSPEFTGTVTFQPGCVIKFEPDRQAGLYASLLLGGGVVCNGSASNPSILTSFYDNQYGAADCPLGYGVQEGDASVAVVLYYISTNVVLNQLVVRYASTAIECQTSCGVSGVTNTIENCYIYRCGLALLNTCTAIIQNSLTNSVTTATACNGQACGFYGSFGAGIPPTANTVSVSPTCALLQQGAYATITASVSPGPATYQWMIYGPGWNPILGATGNPLTMETPTNGMQLSIQGGNPFGACAPGSGQTTASLTVFDPTAMSVMEGLLSKYANGYSQSLWSTMSPSTTNVAWNGNCLIYGVTGFNAISQLNTWDYVSGPGGMSYTPGQLPITALTARHGYMRGHGMGYDNTAGTNYYSPGTYPTVWFSTGTSTSDIVQVHVLATITRAYSPYDYTVALFDTNVTALGITPMQVAMTAPDLGTFANGVELITGQAGGGSVQVFFPSGPCSPFPAYVQEGGDSGSPKMWLTAAESLVFFAGATTSGPCPQMQTDMNSLITIGNNYPYNLNLNPNNYQMSVYTGSD